MSHGRLSLFNQAVSQAGGKPKISDPDENSTEANLCRLWYDTVRDNIQQTAPWASVTTSSRLGVLVERDYSLEWAPTDPGPGWRFAYQPPVNMLRPHYLHSYVPFVRQMWDGTAECVTSPKTVIMTDKKDAILQYARRNEDISDWDMPLYDAVVFALAATIALPLSAKVTLMRELRDMAVGKILLAISEDANEQQVRQEVMPTSLAVRGYNAPPLPTTFVYPFAQLNVVPA